jgi:AcrR family transcriptional regulator
MSSERGYYAKGRVRRQEIVDAALELFARKGYDRTSVREIARITGLSQAGLLHHFGTKEELFLEVLRRRDRRNERYYEEDERNRVTIEGLTHIVDHNAAEPGLVRLYVAMSAESTGDDSASRQFFTERYEILRNDIATDIRLRQESGELPASLDPQGVATLLIAAADGLQIQWLLSPDSIDMGARLADLTRLFTSPRGETTAQAAGERAEGN